ncbi:MAG: hypothetical protein ACHQQS_07800 [Thermoanaerobaculales bacterium]
MRYNLGAFGYVALMRARVTVVDVNRFHDLPAPSIRRGMSPQACDLSPRAACGGGFRERLGG